MKTSHYFWKLGKLSSTAVECILFSNSGSIIEGFQVLCDLKSFQLCWINNDICLQSCKLTFERAHNFPTSVVVLYSLQYFIHLRLTANGTSYSQWHVLHPMARLTANGSPNGNAVFTCSTSHASCRRVGNTCFHNFSIGLCKPKMWIHYYFNIITET